MDIFCCVSADFYKKLDKKKLELRNDISHSVWKDYAEFLDENSSDIQADLNYLRVKFYGDKRMRGSSIENASHFKTYKVGEKLMGEKYIRIHYPVQACWKYIASDNFRITFSSLIGGAPIESIFFIHLYRASLSYYWGMSIIDKYECVAFNALSSASSLFDKCLGILYAQKCFDKKEELSKIRAKAGRKGGESKADVYRVIQNELVSLIYKLAPEGGWKSKTAAIDDVIEPLWNFVEESKFVINNKSKKYRVLTMSQDALADTIRKQWSTKIECVKLAFEDKVTRKKS
ncbi:hypothetical protein C9E92_00695 [Salmonella enterica subsp. enterica serovar Wilhelmsburg]|uniref:Uncharacterized protein n=1 Tax=Salmonella enterica subsp. enterica serovar Wilhelmsburg TaxID=1960126 RepID=A0A659QP08_SALET|nr:hypothetical protein [Salmonella enterica]TGC57580.1 hypothetical protein C9E92_00695 [Salmonella enterica subsp. enterica serovar Wilhelmsburg]TGC62289.1 hypothetical protein C9E97_00370 [Salmonella enterica subsp. enterica serovar Wilhelmsburg]TGC64032.1 hypothetical protein C9E98_12960 [Salmonella enterica subsp. enterica serovar Wilhelmsburg]TGC73269.1 hypothetical protein C9F00_04395 [Salmonella enterica subsp. enterica serovar Wilhelmsburg]TGC88261.1 hypothetical protein C9F02_04620 [